MLMADAERKIQQLYNDVNAIYGMLDKIKEEQGSHGEKLDSLKRGVTIIGATQMRHGNRLDELDAGVEGVSGQLKEMRITQMRHENRFTEIDQRFDAQDDRLDTQSRQLDAQGKQLDAQGKQLALQDRKLDLIMEALGIGAN
jgi:chromosome segregation ATPase